MPVEAVGDEEEGGTVQVSMKGTIATVSVHDVRRADEPSGKDQGK